MKDTHDILIAGGGPAGLAAAIRAAQRGLDCVVVEPRPAPIDKACGEGLMPAGLSRLAELGVVRLDGYPIRGIRYRDAYEQGLSAVGEFEQAGRGVRRLVLHRRLVERARALGVRFVDGRVTDIDQDCAHVTAAGLRARFLVAADGLHSTVRRQLGSDTSPGQPARFGVRRHYAREPWSPLVEVYWSPFGEAYVTPVGPERVGVALLSTGGGRFDDLIGHFPLLAARLDGAAATSQDRGAGPFEQRVQRRVHGRILLVGDAAGYLDPLTGEGITLGIETACAAVDAIADGVPQRYEAAYRRLTRPYYLLTGALLQVSRRRHLHRPLIHALDHLPHVFDAALALLGAPPTSRTKNQEPRTAAGSPHRSPSDQSP